MKIHLHCSVCHKSHNVDLRTIDETFTCDACNNVGQALEESELEVIEKQILLRNKMGILAVIFTFATLFSLWLWNQAFNHDPRAGEFHETLFWVFMGSGLVTFVCGLVNSLNNRKVYF